jgi:hypothetical protein
MDAVSINLKEIRKMQIAKNKTAAIAIAIFLTLSMGASMMLTPLASAHTPAWNIPTYAYINAAPNPIGVGQTMIVYMWLDPVYGAAGGSTETQAGNGSSASSALLANNYRFQNYKLTITAPDGTVSTQTWAVVVDSTSSQYYDFTPTQVGTYNLTFSFPGQVYGANGDGYQGSSIFNDTYSACSASTTLIVQQAPIPAAVTSEPLPTNFWATPIYGLNTNWYTISSNYLGSGSPVPDGYTSSARFSGTNIGPLTTHIMWQTPLQFGGIVPGGEFSGAPGSGFFEGTSYQPRFTNPIIMDGYLYYTGVIAFTGASSGPTVCVSLATGQVLWSRTDVPTLSFGYLYNLWDPDQHGAFPPLLFTASFARCFDGYTGDQLFNVTGVPAGTAVTGPSGENIKYVMTNTNTTANPAWYLSQWNSSRLWLYDVNPFTGGGSMSPSLLNASIAVGPLPSSAVIGTNPYPVTNAAYGNTIIVNANIPINATTLGQIPPYSVPITTYDWNISIPWHNTMALTPSVIAANYGDCMLCRNGSLPAGFPATGTGASQVPFTYFLVNLNATVGPIGEILWMQTYPVPPGNITVTGGTVDWQTRTWDLSYEETMQWVGYSLTNGAQLWGPTASETAFDYYGQPGTPGLAGVMAYGNIYDSSFGGVCYCFNDVTGALLWTWGNGPAGSDNSTNAGTATPYGDYPTFVQAIANGVVYLATDEHTITDPIYKGASITYINATTGQELTGAVLSDYPSEWSGSGVQFSVGDGYLTCMNGYNNEIYCLGQGSSATTVQAPLTAITAGSNVAIQGTVMDTSAGTQEPVVQADFPYGVPVSSDADMGTWMGYVYQQQAMPTNFTGVTVQIAAIDPNGNHIVIGTATTDGNGLYHYTWTTPNVPGTYSVYATFAGSNGYYPSNSETTMIVQNAPSATPAPTATPTSIADLYFLPVSIAIIIAIVIVGAVLALLMLRKRP